MNHTSTSNIHPIVYAIRVLINKLRQNPDVYPIRYYKKGKNFRRGSRPDMYK